MNTTTKFISRKDVRDRWTEKETKELFHWCNERAQKHNKLFKTDEEIELELRKIYDSSFELLLDEDSRGVLIFDDATPFS